MCGAWRAIVGETPGKQRAAPRSERRLISPRETSRAAPSAARRRSFLQSAQADFVAAGHSGATSVASLCAENSQALAHQRRVDKRADYSCIRMSSPSTWSRSNVFMLMSCRYAQTFARGQRSSTPSRRICRCRGRSRSITALARALDGAWHAVGAHKDERRLRISARYRAQKLANQLARPHAQPDRALRRVREIRGRQRIWSIEIAQPPNSSRPSNSSGSSSSTASGRRAGAGKWRAASACALTLAVRCIRCTLSMRVRISGRRSGRICAPMRRSAISGCRMPAVCPPTLAAPSGSLRQSRSRQSHSRRSCSCRSVRRCPRPPHCRARRPAADPASSRASPSALSSLP